MLIFSGQFPQLNPGNFRPRMKPLAQCRLYTFVDTAFLRGRAAAAVAEQLCRGGSDLIQLRAKDCSPGEVRQLAGEIQPVLRRAEVGLVINDHWDIAREMGADFCHLGQEDFFGAGFTHVSQLSALPSPPRVGLSTHAPEQAARASAAGPAYLAIGPVYATGTKTRGAGSCLICSARRKPSKVGMWASVRTR